MHTVTLLLVLAAAPTKLTAFTAAARTTGSSPHAAVAFAGRTFFVAFDEEHGNELWSSDGTPAGTRFESDVYPGPIGADPARLTVAGGQLFFAVPGPAGAIEDPNAAGLWVVGASGAPRQLVEGTVGEVAAFAGRAWFVLRQGATFEVWSTDGTSGGARLELSAPSSLSLSLLAGTTKLYAMNIRTSGSTLMAFTSSGGGAQQLETLPSTTTAKLQAVLANETLVYVRNFQVFATSGTPGAAVSVQNPVQSDAFAATSTRAYFLSRPSFTADWELWSTDGTPAGTERVHAAAFGVSEGLFAAPAGASTLVFGAYEADGGRSSGVEPWSTTGTLASTRRVADLFPGFGGSMPNQFTAVGARACFSAVSPTAGRELFCSDGTVSTPTLLADFTPGAASSKPAVLAAQGGAVLCAADDGAVGLELFSAPATGGSGTLLRDIARLAARNAPSSVQCSLTLGGKLLYITSNELVSTDGTLGGTVVLGAYEAQANVSPSCTVSGARGFFIARDSVGSLLLVTDGTPAGTDEVARFATTLSKPVAMGGKVFFAAGTGTTNGVWVSDGTAAGTFSLTSGFTFTGDVNAPRVLAATATRVFFHATTAAAGNELWATDGTVPGTAMIELVAGATGSLPRDLAVLGNTGILAVNSGAVPSKVMRLDLSQASPAAEPLLPATGPVPSFASALTVFGGRVIFNASGSGVGNEPWSTDGSDAGVVLVRDVADLGNSLPTAPTTNPFVVTSSGVYFVNEATPSELWVTDGLDAGRVLADAGAIFSVAPFGNVAFLALALGPWVSDGTVSGTRPLTNGGPGFANDPRPIAAVGSSFMFYAGSGSATGRWKTDGTAINTVPLDPIVPSLDLGRSLAAAGASVYFPYDDGTHGLELFELAAGNLTPTRVTDVFPGPGGSLPQNLFGTDAGLFFTATDPAAGREPYWLPRGGSALRIADVRAGPLDFNPVEVAQAGDRIFFIVGYPTNELWAVDVRTGVASRVYGRGNGLSALQPIGDELYFVEDTGSNAPFSAVRHLAAGSTTVDDPFAVPAVVGLGVDAIVGRVGNWLLANVTVFPSSGLWRGNVFSSRFEPYDTVNPGANSLVRRALQTPGALYFTAFSPDAGNELYVTSGDDGGTRRLELSAGPRSSLPGPSFAAVSSTTGVAFAANGGTAGRELWALEPADAGVRLLADVNAGPLGSYPTQLFTAGNTLLFAAATADAGNELWAYADQSGGLTAFAELSPGASSSNPSGFVQAGARVVFTAHDGTARQLYAMTIDTSPPVITETLAGTLVSGALYASDVTVSFAVADPETAPVLTGCDGGTLTTDGTATFDCLARSEGGNASRSVTVTRDVTAPAVSCAMTVDAGATGPGGAVVVLPTPSVTDTVDMSPMQTSSAPAGNQFPLGDTAVTFTAIDQAGHLGTCTTHVVVTDVTAPAVTCPPRVDVESSEAETEVTFAVTASDAVDGTPALVVTPPSGSKFGQNITDVSAVATDAAGNTATCAFKVTVTCPPSGCAGDTVLRSNYRWGCASTPGTFVAVALAMLLIRRRREGQAAASLMGRGRDAK